MRPSAEVPAFIDIREFSATSGDGTLLLTMSLAAAVPPGTPPVGLLAYRFLLDLDGDGEWDRTAVLELAPGGGFVPVLLDRVSSERLEGARYPGTANLAGSRISMTVPLAALGCPSTIAARALAEQTRGGSTLSDEAPGPPELWTRIETAC